MGERDRFPFSPKDSPDSVEKENRASAVFPFSVVRRSASIRISPSAVRNGAPREASENRTFPPERRNDSTEKLPPLSSPPDFGGVSPPSASAVFPFSLPGSKDNRFKFPFRSIA